MARAPATVRVECDATRATLALGDVVAGAAELYAEDMTATEAQGHAARAHEVMVEGRDLLVRMESERLAANRPYTDDERDIVTHATVRVLRLQLASARLSKASRPWEAEGG